VRPGAQSGGFVIRVQQLAAVDRQAAATDACRHSVAERGQRLDPTVKIGPPTA
jgi:hypothetical protein